MADSRSSRHAKQRYSVRVLCVRAPLGFLATETPAASQNMNYSVLVTGAVIPFSIAYYLFRGHKKFKGPLIDNEIRLPKSQCANHERKT